MERLPCLFCQKTYLNADSVIEHCGRVHHPELNTSDAVYGDVCPICGLVYARLPQHSSRVHGRQIALLFADARRAGDPHGVVRIRLRRYVRMLAEQLESGVG